MPRESRRQAQYPDPDDPRYLTAFDDPAVQMAAHDDGISLADAARRVRAQLLGPLIDDALEADEHVAPSFSAIRFNPVDDTLVVQLTEVSEALLTHVKEALAALDLQIPIAVEKVDHTRAQLDSVTVTVSAFVFETPPPGSVALGPDTVQGIVRVELPDTANFDALADAVAVRFAGEPVRVVRSPTIASLSARS